MSKQVGKSKTSVDAKRLAKPVGARFKGNNYSKPTAAETEKGLKSGKVYIEDRKNRSDANPRTSVGHRKGVKSLKCGGYLGLGL